MYDLNGRVAIVTGSGKGIGAGIAKQMAAAGANSASVKLMSDFLASGKRPLQR